MSGSGLMAGLLRVLLLALSAVFVVSLIVAGLFVVLVSVLWSLVRGRKPAVFHIYTQFRDASRRFHGAAFTPRPTQASTEDIVDVDAREVDGTSKLR